MKNLFKIGAFAFSVSLTLAACGDGDKTHKVIDTTKTETTVKTDVIQKDTSMVADTTKKDTSKIK